MRPLTESETKAVFEKLAKYLDSNVTALVDREDKPHCFRLQKERVFYVDEALLKHTSKIPRKIIKSLGVCVGKFTKTKKFHLQVTFLDYLVKFAKFKVWVRPAGEQAFLYGNNVIKRHVGRVSEGTPANAGVVVLSMTDVPLGFGASSRSTVGLRSATTETIAVYRQADVGEYLREEADLV